MDKCLFQDLSDKMGENQYAKVGVTCYDCGKEFTLNLTRTSETDVTIDNGLVGVRKTANREGKHECKFMCLDCAKIDPSFGDKCEVYSRVVGYLRPVSNWNQGKQSEFGMRKMFNQPTKGEI